MFATCQGQIPTFSNIQGSVGDPNLNHSEKVSFDERSTVDLDSNIFDSKIFESIKLIAFADCKVNVAQGIVSGFDRVETMWKYEKMLFTSILNFSPFP